MIEKILNSFSMDIPDLIATILNGTIMVLAVGGAFYSVL
jgi:hypothetical protein